MDWFYIVPAVSAVGGTAGMAFVSRKNEGFSAGPLYIDFVRIFFAVHLIFSGVRFFLSYSQPIIPHPIAGPFMASLYDMGLFPAIKFWEICVGVGLLLKRFVPLLLVTELPTTIIIFYMNVFITGGLRQWISGPLELVVHGVLMFAYFDYYRTMLVCNADAVPFWKLKFTK